MALIPSLRQVVLASALVGLVLAGCSSSAPDDAAAITTSSTTPPTTAAPEPMRFVLAGDSMMYDVAPGVAAAVDPASAEVIPLVVPSLFSPTVGTSLMGAVSSAPTDAVVVLAGIWETGYETSSGLTVVDPGWGDAYRAEILLPFADRIAELGAHLVLLGNPPLREGDSGARLAAVYGEWERLAAERPDTVTFRSTGPWLEVGESYVEVVAVPDGAPLRLRRTDGVHFCAEGATRMARGLIAVLVDVTGGAWEPVVVDGWQQGAWLERFPPDECPVEEAS